MQKQLTIQGGIDLPVFADGFDLGEYVYVKIPIARIVKHTERLKVDKDSGDSEIVETVTIEIPVGATVSPAEKAVASPLFGEDGEDDENENDPAMDHTPAQVGAE